MAGITVAVMSVFTVGVATAIMGAVVAVSMRDDNRSANFEFRAAAAIDPDTAIVIAPRAILNALGVALLVDHLNAAGSIHEANVAMHIVRRARHSQGGLRRRRGVNGPALGGNHQDECGGNYRKQCEHTFARYGMKTGHKGISPFHDRAGANQISGGLPGWVG